MDYKEDFIKKAKEIHKGENLDYSQVEYINNRTPVKIIDHDLDDNGIEYGEFWQTPWNHLKGQSNPKKRAKKISLSKRDNQEEIIKRFKEVHKGENLDYSQVKYVNMHTKVKIICHDLRPDGTEYGEFWQEPAVHLKGCSHPEKGILKTTLNSKYTTDIFIEKAKKIDEEGKYSFDKVNYINSKTKVCIYCNKIGGNNKPHGEFYISPDLFLQGKGCPKCGNHLSYGENEIIELLNEYLGKENVIHNDKTILNGKELDIYIPSLKIAIEYNGLKWHSEEYGKDKNYHLNKTIACKDKGITLIHIFEDEYINHKDIVLNKILNIIGKNKSIHIGARKCNIKRINKHNAEIFLNKNHIQGFVTSSVYIGLFYEEKLIAVMSFLNENNGNWNLTRYATDNTILCQGGASKILKYFIKEYNPIKIKSFLDRRWVRNEEDNLYTKIGFKFEKFLKPDYRYFKTKIERLHKFGFRKQILHKKYGLPLSMTESEMAKMLGYYRIYDCGLIKYIWKRKED